MKFALYTVCLFAALLTKGNTLTCYECVSTTGVPCTGVPKICPYPADTCVTMNMESTTAGIPVKMFIRGCDRSASCISVSSYSSPEMSVRAAVACCGTDNCTPAQTPVLPPASTAPNGVVCDWCFQMNSDTCSSQGTKQCTGDERRCIYQSTKVTSGTQSLKVALRGCATENLCAAEKMSEALGDLTGSSKTVCTNSGIHTEYGFFLPALTGLVLLQIF